MESLRWLAPLCACSLGCVGAHDISLPEGAKDATSIIVLGFTDFETFAVAADADATSALTVPDGADALLLLYSRPLSELGVEPGLLPTANAPPDRPLPRPQAAFEASPLEAGVWRGWAIDDLTDYAPFRNFRLPAKPVQACVAEGGCYLGEDLEGACIVPCPEPDAPAPPVAPEMPAPPVFTVDGECPSGWAEVEDPLGGFTICEPRVRQPSCPAENIDLPSTGCTALGSPCPTTDIWPQSLPAVGVVYVDSSTGTPAGGNGSKSAPFASLQVAVDAATSGSTVALALGEHGPAVLSKSLHLVGACAAGTTIRSTAPGHAINAGSDDVSLEDLTLVGENGVTSSGPGELRLERVHVIAAGQLTEEGVRANGGLIIADGLKVEGFNAAIVVVEASATLRRAFVEAPVVGLFVQPLNAPGQVIAIEDSRLTAPKGEALGVQPGASLSLRTSTLESMRGLSIWAESAEVEDVVVLRDGGKLDQTLGGYATLGDVRMSRVRFEGYSRCALVGKDARLTLEDVVVRGLESLRCHVASEDSACPTSGLVAEGGDLYGRRVVISDYSCDALEALGADVSLSDLTLDYSEGWVVEPDNRDPLRMVVLPPEGSKFIGSLELRRVRTPGLTQTIDLDHVTIEDATVSYLEPQGRSDAAIDILATRNGTVLSRVAIEGRWGKGMAILRSVATVTDVRMRGVVWRALDVISESEVSGARVDIAEGTGVAIRVENSATLDLEDVAVRKILRQIDTAHTCVLVDCLGVGIAFLLDAQQLDSSIRRFTVEETTAVGAWLTRGSLSNGSIRNNTGIGLQISEEVPASERIRRVRFSGNVRDVELIPGQ